MKTLFVILFTLLTFAAHAQNVNTRIQQIRKEVALIDGYKLDIRSYSYSNNCGLVKATIKMYYKNGEVKKITDIGVGDDDKAAAAWNYEYYYNRDTLIFSHERKRYFDNEKNQNINEDIRQYFVSDRLIGKIENTRTTFPEEIFISRKDIRYQLRLISKRSDIDKIYNCPN